MRNGFKDYRLIISLESFGIKRTDENQFEYHEYMKNLNELSTLTDSLRKEYTNTSLTVASTSRQYYTYQFKADAITKQKAIKDGKWVDSLLKKRAVAVPDLAQSALTQAQSIQNYATSNVTYLTEKKKMFGGINWKVTTNSRRRFRFSSCF